MDSSIRTEEEKNIDYGYGHKDESECPEAEYPPSLQNTDYLLFATFLVTHEDAKAYMYSLSSKRRVHKWKDIRVNLYI